MINDTCTYFKFDLILKDLRWFIHFLQFKNFLHNSTTRSYIEVRRLTRQLKKNQMSYWNTYDAKNTFSHIYYPRANEILWILHNFTTVFLYGKLWTKFWPLEAEIVGNELIYGNTLGKKSEVYQRWKFVCHPQKLYSILMKKFTKSLT